MLSNVPSGKSNNDSRFRLANRKVIMMSFVYCIYSTVPSLAIVSNFIVSAAVRVLFNSRRGGGRRRQQSIETNGYNTGKTH